MIPGLELMHGLVLEDGQRWGPKATSWQHDDAAALLAVGAGAPRYHFLTRPRGGSKTTDLAAFSIAWLVDQAPPGGRGFVAACDEDQAALLIEAAEGFRVRTPGLASAIRVLSDRIVVPSSGAAMVVLAADGPGNFGKRPLVTIVDEAAQLPSTRAAIENWTALTSAVIKGKGVGRLVVMTTAGDPAHRSFRLLEHARASDRWRVSEVLGPLPWMDEGDLQEQRVLLTEWSYQRLHENRWVGADDRLVSVEGLAECVTLSEWPLPAAPGVRYRMGLDLGLKNDRTVLSVVHAERVPGAAQRVVLDRQVVLQGSRREPLQLSVIEAAVVQAWEEYDRPPLSMDPWQAVGLGQRLRGRGMRVEEYAFSQASVGRLASTLHLLLRDQRLALPDDEDLLEELANVRLIEKGPGLLRMDHDPGRHDDRAISLALACLPLEQRQAGAGRVATAVGGGRVARGTDAMGTGLGSLDQRLARRVKVAGGDPRRYTPPAWRASRRGAAR